MKPIDKFGNPIYPTIFAKLRSIGTKLIQFNFVEDENSPNLFYKNVNSGVIYADLRGNYLVKIWEDPVPLFYFRFHKKTPIWKQIRIRKTVESSMKRLDLGFELNFYHSEGEDTYLAYRLRDKHVKFFGREDLFDEWIHEGGDDWGGPDPFKVDGFCIVCRKDIQRDTLFCDRCFNIEFYKRKALQEYQDFLVAVSKLKSCFVCKKTIFTTKTKAETPTDYEYEKWLFRYSPVKGVIHHISYFPESTISVCTDCHNLIHNTYKFPELKPPKGESMKFYGVKE